MLSFSDHILAMVAIAKLPLTFLKSHAISPAPTVGVMVRPVPIVSRVRNLGHHHSLCPSCCLFYPAA
jgi:hypothetical protein